MEESLKSRLLAVKSGHGIGKSTTCAWLMMHHMLCFYPQKTVCTAPTAAQLFDALFAELKSQLLLLPPALKGLFEVFSERITLKSDPAGSFISCRTARKESPEALQGIHSSGKVLLIVDEASSVDNAIFGTSKFFKEKQDEKKEDIYSNIDEMLNSTLDEEEKDT